MYTTLISSTELAANLGRSDFLPIDCRFDLAKPESGEAAYRVAHIPGAIYAHLDRDLSAPITPSSGRHPLPDPTRFAETLSRWGIDRNTQVVAYDADNAAHAARLWWMLRWMGHEKVAVLDGGLKAWQDAGLPLTAELPVRVHTNFPAQARREMWLNVEELQQRLAQGWRLLDARAAERFAGKIEPIDPVAGHIPGAVNHPLSTNLAPDLRFLPAEVLRERYARSQNGVDDAHTIAMCGSGVTACHLLLAMEVAGKPGARLYAGSWSEWIRDPSRPTAVGDSG
jgi:thiosulfate/3-mercaptopyruvate sulfurtransferase